MPTADPAAQRALLELAEIDRDADAATHRRGSLPELQLLADGARRLEELDAHLVLAQADVDDLDTSARKLDEEIDAVRARAARDNDLLTSGGVPAKEAQGLQQELESLARRQSTLEDEALDVMEKREGADAALAEAQVERDRVRCDLDAAATRRDDAYADIDDELAQLSARREATISHIPDAVLAIYERVRGQGKTAAGALAGDRCSACQMSLDRQSLEDIHRAAADRLHRCPECSAILVRVG